MASRVAHRFCSWICEIKLEMACGIFLEPDYRRFQKDLCHFLSTNHGRVSRTNYLTCVLRKLCCPSKATLKRSMRSANLLHQDGSASLTGAVIEGNAVVQFSAMLQLVAHIQKFVRGISPRKQYHPCLRLSSLYRLTSEK